VIDGASCRVYKYVWEGARESVCIVAKVCVKCVYSCLDVCALMKTWFSRVQVHVYA